MAIYESTCFLGALIVGLMKGLSCGVQLQPLVDALRAEILQHSVLHADETPVQMLRAGEHARAFLGDWKGSLICDDYAGYKQSIASGVTEVGCLAHSRRKFFDLHVANKSQVAESALQQIGTIYEIERELKNLDSDERQRIRQLRSAPMLVGTSGIALENWFAA